MKMITRQENGKRTAKEVQKMISNGKLVNKTKAQLKVGYSENSAKAMKGINNKGYEEEMQSFINKLEKVRNKALKEIDNKNLSDVEYRDLTKSLDILTKNIQLLSGKPTERNKLIISEEDKEITDKVLNKL